MEDPSQCYRKAFFASCRARVLLRSIELSSVSPRKYSLQQGSQLTSIRVGQQRKSTLEHLDIWTSVHRPPVRVLHLLLEYKRIHSTHNNVIIEDPRTLLARSWEDIIGTSTTTKVNSRVSDVEITHQYTILIRVLSRPSQGDLTSFKRILAISKRRSRKSIIRHRFLGSIRIRQYMYMYIHMKGKFSFGPSGGLRGDVFGGVQGRHPGRFRRGLAAWFRRRDVRRARGPPQPPFRRPKSPFAYR